MISAGRRVARRVQLHQSPRLGHQYKIIKKYKIKIYIISISFGCSVVIYILYHICEVNRADKLVSFLILLYLRCLLSGICGKEEIRKTR